MSKDIYRIDSIELKGISHKYGVGEYLFKDIDLNMTRGCRICLVGRNGSGKTTLLKIIALNLLPSTGSYQVDGINIYEKGFEEIQMFKRRYIGFSFQEPTLIDSLNLIGNIKIIEYIRGVEIDLDGQSFNELISLLGLKDKLHIKVKKLSGGERKKLDILRAIIFNPEILVLDEPTAHLDRRSYEIVINLIDGWLKNPYIIYSTPRESRLMDISTEVIDLDNI